MPPHLSRPQIVMEQAGTMPGLATALRGRSRELGSRGALSLTPPVASCAGPSVPGGVGSVKGMWVALAMRPQRPWRGLREGQRGRQAPTFSKDAQGLPAGWEHMGEARAVGTQSPPRCCVRFRPASAPLATGSGEGWGARLVKVGCAQKVWKPEPGFLAAGSAGQEAGGPHQVLPEPRSSGLRRGKKRQLLPKVAVTWGSVVRALFGLGRLDPAASAVGAGCEAWASSRLAVPSQRWSWGALVCDTFVSGPGQDASPLPPAVSAGAPGCPPRAPSVHGVAPTVCSSACPVRADTRPRDGGRGPLSHLLALQLRPAPSLGACPPRHGGHLSSAVSHSPSPRRVSTGGLAVLQGPARLPPSFCPGTASARMVPVLSPDMLSEPGPSPPRTSRPCPGQPAAAVSVVPALG